MSYRSISDSEYQDWAGPEQDADLVQTRTPDAAQAPGLSISVHGLGASIDTAIATGEAMKGLLDAVGEELGVAPGAVKWEIASVQFRCDWCGLLRADRPGPEEGWTFRDGDDLCPRCTKEAEANG